VITIQDADVWGLQELATPVADGSTTWTITGTLNVGFVAQSNTPEPFQWKETYRLLIGLPLAPGGRAIASVWPSNVGLTDHVSWAVRAAEADIDDESGRVQLTFELVGWVSPESTGQRAVEIEHVGFLVTAYGDAA
jgi:hypothetical protein